ncbi:MAG: hypothetical protein M1834_006059 [Cirrosporium novae-zelandiae]|nr:MAG: hypothetical protein M1834_006059 [Cirrosporium novae-zelandiae]
MATTALSPKPQLEESSTYPSVPEMPEIAASTEYQHFNNWPNDAGFDVFHEERNPVELKVTGNIPEWACGTLYRTGPGHRSVTTDQGTAYKSGHWFDGFSQVHRFQILPAGSPDADSPVRILYNSRRTCDGLIEKIRKTGKLDGFTFGRKYDPCQNLFKKVMSTFEPADSNIQTPDSRNMGVTISVNFPGLPEFKDTLKPSNADGAVRHNTPIRTICNKTDRNGFQLLDPETLAPVGLCDQSVLHPDLTGPLSGTHAKSDPITGDVYNYNLDLGANPTYRLFHVSASTGTTSILATFHAPAAYIHSIFLTANHVILCVWPAHLALNGAKMLHTRNIIDAISDFDPTAKAEWFVVDRTPSGCGLVSKFESPAFFAFHSINAFEEPNRNPNNTSTPSSSSIDIVADVTAYNTTEIITSMYYENLLSNSPAAIPSSPPNPNTAAQIRRYRLPNIPFPSPTKNPTTTPIPIIITTTATTTDFTTPTPLQSPELAIINPTYLTRPHRYIYGITQFTHSTFVDGLVKLDTTNPTNPTPLIWREHAQSPGEAIFIPRPRSGKCEDKKGEMETEEDDGILLSVVLDGNKGTSYLLCLDAKTMREVGRAECEWAVAFGFHGTFVPEFGGREGGRERAGGREGVVDF